MLLLFLVSSVLWAVTGWDGTIQQVFGLGPYGVGIHLSTAQTFFFFFYLLALNMQTGGLESFGQFWHSVKEDLWSIRHYSLGIRKRYLKWVIEPKSGVAFVILICVFATFAFENAWVLLYNRTQFGNWLWPIYYVNTSNPFFRNVMLGFTIPLILAPMTKYLTASGIWRPSGKPYSIKWRFDNTWGLIVVFTLILWLVWISGYFPHATLPLSGLKDSEVLGNMTNFTLAGVNWIYPAQQLFPQTTYTFYPPSTYLQGYDPKQIYGFWVHDDFLHLINTVTKYATFLAVCYPALVRVKR